MWPEWFSQTTDSMLERRIDEVAPEVQISARILYKRYLEARWNFVVSLLTQGFLLFHIFRTPLPAFCFLIIISGRHLYSRQKSYRLYLHHLEQYRDPHTQISTGLHGLDLLKVLRRNAWIIAAWSIFALGLLLDKTILSWQDRLCCLLGIFNVTILTGTYEAASLLALLLLTQRPQKKQTAKSKIIIREIAKEAT